MPDTYRSARLTEPLTLGSESPLTSTWLSPQPRSSASASNNYDGPAQLPSPPPQTPSVWVSRPSTHLPARPLSWPGFGTVHRHGPALQPSISSIPSTLPADPEYRGRRRASENELQSLTDSTQFPRAALAWHFPDPAHLAAKNSMSVSNSAPLQPSRWPGHTAPRQHEGILSATALLFCLPTRCYSAIP